MKYFVLLSAIVFTASSAHAAPGDLDPTFGVGGRVIEMGNIWFDIAIQPDGKIVTGGAGPMVARYNVDGSPDSTFGNAGKVFIPPPDNKGWLAMDVAIQPDGKIVVGARDANGSVPGAVYRLDPNGSMDTSFGTNGGLTGFFLPTLTATLPGGKLIINQGTTLLRFNANGSHDPTFAQCAPGVGSSHYLYNRSDSVILADSKILTQFTNGGSSGFGVFRCNADGTRDNGFGSSGVVTTPMNEGAAQSIALQTDGKFIVAGQNRTSDWKLTLVRYNSNGSLDTGFGTEGIVTSLSLIGPIYSMVSVAVQANGKIVANATTPSFESAVVRFNPNGSLDTTFGGGDGIANIDFNNGGRDYVNAMALDGQGRAVVVGTAANIPQTVFNSALARLFGDTVFGIGFEGDVAPRNSGDGTVTATDVTQMRRFVTGLDTLSENFNELQRADSAPRATQGDGVVTSADVVQARRYATGLDPLTDAGGPIAAVLPPPETVAPLAGSRSDTIESFLLVGKTMAGNRKITVPIELTSPGDVVAAGFTLDYDTAMLSNPSVALAAEMPSDVVLTYNPNTQGQVRVLIDSTQPLLRSKGNAIIVFVTFDIPAHALVGQRVVSSIRLRRVDLSDAL